MSSEIRNPIEKEFMEITGFVPYAYQRSVAERIEEGENPVVVAPTGVGKTEAAIFPFLANERESELAPHLFYVLPTRILVNSVYERIQRYTDGKLQVSRIHGRAEGLRRERLEARVIVSTIDQFVSIYCCSPLSLSRNMGNLFAGAAVCSAVVFDEVHMLDPTAALGTALGISKLARSLSLPVVFMSATLGDELSSYIHKLLNPKSSDGPLIVKEESEFSCRAERKVHYFFKGKIPDFDADAVLNCLEDGVERIIICVNRVDTAQNIYEKLKKLSPEKGFELILAHSRFVDADRVRIEKRIVSLFGKDRESVKSDGAAILVTTQVVEAGIDISADVIITELAPVEALVQRAGRCARWGGRGKFVIMDMGVCEPYDRPLVEHARRILEEEPEGILDWKKEREWINSRTPGEEELHRLEIHSIKNLIQLADASIRHDMGDIEKNVRERVTCEVALSSLIESGDNCESSFIHSLPTIPVDFRVLRGKLEDGTVREIYEVDYTHLQDRDDGTIALRRVKSAKCIYPNGFYICKPYGISYIRDLGLLFTNRPEGVVLDKTAGEREEFQPSDYPSEKWIDHARRTSAFFAELLPRYHPIIERLAEKFGMKGNDLEAALCTAAALHDIGKLDEQWQRNAGGTSMNWLAHYANAEHKRNVPHAATAYSSTFCAFGSYFSQFISGDRKVEKLRDAISMAMAHHHSVFVNEAEKYRLVDGWKDLVSAIVHADMRDHVSQISATGNVMRLPSPFDISNDPIPYQLYCVASRLIRLSDQRATGAICND